MEMERGIMKFTEDQKTHLKKIGVIQTNKDRSQEEKLRLWEVEKIELVHRNKIYQRTIDDLKEKILEL